VGLVQAIKGIFTNELDVRVSQDLVTVAWDGQSLSFRPVVHVVKRGGLVRVVGVAEQLPSDESSTLVPVFGPLPASIEREQWPKLLSMFMQYVVAHARSRLVAMRPTIRVHGVATLTSMPGVDIGLALQNVLIRAGAVHCTIED